MADSRRWRWATVAAIAIWVALVARLMIADVWDETNGMLFFSSASLSLGAKLKFVLTQSLGFWRPLPTLLIAAILHAVPDFDVSWRILRALNIALLLGALLFLTDAITRWSERDERRRFVFTIAFLFSASAIIVASWYANMFDAAALLLIAIALSLLARGKDLAAGVVIGVAFFCKETTALALPFLLVLFAAGRITFRQALRCGIPALILGAAYFAIRARIVPFGTAGDVHGFAPELFGPTILNLAESFWRQSLKEWTYSGYGALIFSLASLRRPRVIAAVLLFLLATAVIYWGMFGEYQNGVLLHHLNFCGRLYLIPSALLLFLLAIERRTLVTAILIVPILIGAATTYRDHQRFQRTYRRVYKTARDSSTKPLTVHYAMKPLDDTVRGIKIGEIPEARVVLEPKSGELLFR